MHYPQLLIYESDRRLAELLRPEAEQHRWSLREPRGLDACLRLLRVGGPSVLVLKLGKDLLRELTLLERVTWFFPETDAVVVGDTDNPELAGLAWDLGARFVLFPPLPRQELPALVRILLQPAARNPAPEAERRAIDA
jgi:DNA-binding response OmpR family regulator